MFLKIWQALALAMLLLDALGNLILYINKKPVNYTQQYRLFSSCVYGVLFFYGLFAVFH